MKKINTYAAYAAKFGGSVCEIPEFESGCEMDVEVLEKWKGHVLLLKRLLCNIYQTWKLVAMELTPSVVNDVIHPTAAFVDLSSREYRNGLGAKSGENESVPWSGSQLNPKNRIDSLDELPDPKWRIDGCSGLGTQFFTIPLYFTGKVTPVRVDTFIPEWEKCPSSLRPILGLGTAFHVKDARIMKLGIAKHILRTLDYWSTQNPDFEAIYDTLPFGSRIVFENIAANVRDIRVRIIRTHNLERQLLSCASLQSFWGLAAGDWPETVDIGQIQICRQLHDSVSVVRLKTAEGSQILVMKALTSFPKYLYHELKRLLTLPPHPNIISRPQHLVTKKCGFGSKNAVVGFTLPYHPSETLRDILPFRHIHGTLHAADQMKWAVQLTSALVHIHNHGSYYSDLRLDNILLSQSDDLVLVDFEQRGVWCGFASPELNFLDYIFMVATDSNVTAEITERYEKLLERYIPGYKALLGNEYHNPVHGYSIPWSGLSRSELESIEVFMLGRVLWCIFEGQSSPEVALWQSYRYESDLQFPSYQNTPSAIRDLIHRCTASGEILKTHNDGGVVRRGDRLVLKDGDGSESPESVQAEATRWWKKELQQAESFLELRLKSGLKGEGGDSKTLFSLSDALGLLVGLQSSQDDEHKYGSGRQGD